MSNTSTIYVYLIHYKVVKLIKGDFIMGIAYHKKTSTKYVQYTLRIEESIPVSYTHLDVYKRQSLYLIKLNQLQEKKIYL